MSEKIRFAMNGACGRMGRQIIACAAQDASVQLVGALERKGAPLMGQDIGSIVGCGALNISVSSSLEEIKGSVDAVIDFSSPESSLELAKIAAARKIPLVIGTTGFTSQQETQLKEIVKSIACVKAPNMSMGVNLLFKLVEEAAKVLKSYDKEIVEAHHHLKKDAPSGTAKGILQAMQKGLGKNIEKDVVTGRSGMVGERKPDEIGVFAVRAGDIVGDHTVLFAGGGERLELIHRAHSREPFAQGSLTAAKFAAKAKPGFYDMQDVLGLK
jgi:4-hydroxy-tetrahydrodipicolinate reductase